MQKSSNGPPPETAQQEPPAVPPEVEGKLITEKEFTQVKLSGEVAINFNEFEKRYEVLGLPGYRMVVGDDAMVGLATRIASLRKKLNAPQLAKWKEAWVLNHVKAIPVEDHTMPNLSQLTKAAQDYLFSDKKLPKSISFKPLTVEFVEWECPKYYVRLKKSSFERKKDSLRKGSVRKPPTKNPAKYVTKAEADMISFVSKKMRPKRGVFHTEGEFRGYRKKMMESMFKDLREIVDGAQKKLEV